MDKTLFQRVVELEERQGFQDNLLENLKEELKRERRRIDLVFGPDPEEPKAAMVRSDR